METFGHARISTNVAMPVSTMTRIRTPALAVTKVSAVAPAATRVVATLTRPVSEIFAQDPTVAAVRGPTILSVSKASAPGPSVTDKLVFTVLAGTIISSRSANT